MPDHNRILIFSGGNLGSWALDEVNKGDFVVGVDRGALFLINNHLEPNIIIGDFDSLTPDEFRFIRCRCKDVISCDPVFKDFTDTEMAFNWALQKKPAEIIMLGATGTRFDHTLANVHLLYKGLKEGIGCRIIDDNNEIIAMNGFAEITRSRFTHVSLLPLSTTVTGITLDGFQYPLNNATLNMGTSLAVSNILIPGTNAGTIKITSGELLIIKSRD